MKSLASLPAALLHPHQLEVQEFGCYALVIDARSPRDFEADHLPDAINLPSGSEAAEARLETRLEALGPLDRVLVYCGRGGIDCQAWRERIEAKGLDVDVLPGGWVNYRRWVDAGLELLPRHFDLRRALASSRDGADPLAALDNAGEQTVDLASIVRSSRLALAKSWKPGPAINSEVVDLLRRMDPERPVWVSDAAMPEVLPLLPPVFGVQLRLAPVVALDGADQISS